VIGASLALFVTAEVQRRRWWDYWRDFARRRFQGNKELTDDLDGITVNHVVSPQSNITSQLHVDILTIPPLRQLTGKSRGVEMYLLVKGSLMINDVAVSSHVVEPFQERCLINPSSTVAAVVWRSADGPPHDASVEPGPAPYADLVNYLTDAALTLWPSTGHSKKTNSVAHPIRETLGK